MKNPFSQTSLVAQRAKLSSVGLSLLTTALCGLLPAAVHGDEGAEHATAREDYLRAMLLAEEGSQPEALRVLAESLRLQPKGNPAAALAFQLLTEQRTNSRLLLRGHRGAVLSAVYSPDGGKIVTASEDHTARLWDARTGQQIGPVLQHDDDVPYGLVQPGWHAGCHRLRR